MLALSKANGPYLYDKMTTENNLTHASLHRCLESLALPTGPSEVQGVLCGLLCGGSENPRELWLTELLPGPLDEENLLHQECMHNLTKLLQQTQEAFDGPGLGFSLLLPEEDLPLQHRAAETVGWCQGFLYGLGLAGAPLDNLSEEAREGLNDISEITRLELQDLSNGEQEENDLTELVEFIWVAVMLIREELVHAPRGE